MNDLCRILEQVDFEKEEKLAVATIIRINGSSYRKVGAKMFFLEHGQRFGTISAGCLEDDLALHSTEAIKRHHSKIITYDLQDEEDLGWGIGCNGKIEVYIEPNCNQSLLKLKEYLFNGRKAVSVKPLLNDKSPVTYLFTQDGDLIDCEIEMELHNDITTALHEFLHSNQKLKIITFEGEDYLFEIHHPKSYLYIFGAGNDAEPLVKLATSLDFFVTVIDPRESRCNRDFFPTADELIIEHPDTFFRSHELYYSCFVVIMNHHFLRDKQIIEKLSFERSAYIGILGSKKRTERLLINLNDSIKSQIHYPIGLNIQAEGPDEISVSIMAELIQVRHKLIDILPL